MPKPDYTSLTFPAPPADRPYVVANMIASVDGRATVEGDEKGLGSATDQRLMRELRVHADVILAGAGTVRATGASPRLGDPLLEQLRLDHGKLRLATSAVLSRSGDLPLDRALFTASDFDAIVYLSEAAPSGRRRAIEATGRPVVLVPASPAAAMLRHMRDHLGASLVLCEGGPEINGLLLDAGCLDELFLTVGPVLVGGPSPLTVLSTPSKPSRDRLQRLSLIHAVPNEETGEVYLRYRVARP